MSSKEKALRIAVGGPEDARSSLYRTWVWKNDIYFGAVDGLQAFKFSLHQSGVWRAAFSEPLDSQDKDSDRAALKWKRPAEWTPGWTVALTVLVPSIRPLTPSKPRQLTDRRIQWLPVPTAGNRLTLALLISKPGQRALVSTLAGYTEAGRLNKEDGETVWVTWRQEQLTHLQTAKVKEIMQGVKVGTDVAAAHNMFSSRAFSIVADDADAIGPTNPPTIFDVEIGMDNIRPSVEEGRMRLRQLDRHRWPPSAAVRQRSIADITIQEVPGLFATERKRDRQRSCEAACVYIRLTDDRYQIIQQDRIYRAFVTSRSVAQMFLDTFPEFLL